VTLCAAAGGAALCAVAISRYGAVGTPLHVPWWLLAALFGLAEVYAVHIQLRGESHTVSLSELPLVIGLLCASPLDVLTARLVGGGLALALHRRQRPLKLGFNLSLFALETGTATLVLHSVLGSGEPLSAMGWGATGAAMLCTSLLSSLCIALVMAIASGASQLRRLPGLLGFALSATAVNTVVGLAGARLIERDAVTILLLVVPGLALAVAYRAYISEREKHERIARLYESSRAFQGAQSVDVALSTLLAQGRAMFGAEIAELTVVPAGSAGEAVRFSVGQVGADALHESHCSADDVHLGLFTGEAVLVRQGRRGDVLARRLATRGIGDAMITTIPGDAGVLGTLLIGNRRGSVAGFQEDDLALFETFSRQASAAIENGRLEAELRRLAFHDTLTGLANRALFTARLERALERRARTDTVPSVLFIDLDDFKTVNDSLGHVAGDALLSAVGGRLESVLRSGDLAARLGGDEFAILVDGVEDSAVPISVAERVIDALRPSFRIHGADLTIHGSVGIVVATPVMVRADELLASADVAMYRAKARGKDCIEVFEPSMQLAVMERHHLKLDLQRALDRGELAVHYQPIVALADGAVRGAEALVRWNHPTRGMVPPDGFIPLAEETGLILPLGRAVLEQACWQGARWQELLPNFILSVNISDRQLRDAHFIAEVTELLSICGLDPHSLVLEITEHVMTHDDEATRSALHQLRALGVRIALDDFGTGYSSLSRLGELPVDILKIDKQFVDGLDRGPRNVAFSGAIVRLGQSLGLEMIVEGIERHEQLEQLRPLLSGMGQGYLFGAAMEARELTARLQRAGHPRAERRGSRYLRGQDDDDDVRRLRVMTSA
jgi:diguanylate cyclase (GGDEF)-like protein